MPERADGKMPPLLSQTGAFTDVRSLSHAASLIPYTLNISFWSDGASKTRWVSLPDSGEKVGFSAQGEWKFPVGTVFVKTFEMALDEAHPEIRRRLETRLIVRIRDGSVYGVTYKWRPDNSDADLLATNLTEEFPIHTSAGVKSKSWYYPSREDCRTCHTDLNGGVLGVNARQMNRDFSYRAGIAENQLRIWNDAGLFETPLTEAQITGCARLAPLEDSTRTLEDRARSYLDANCGHCHRPRGTVAAFDARYDVPLNRQNLIGGQVLLDEGIDNPRVIAPHDIWRSILYMRASAVDAIKMPPLAHAEADSRGMALLREWIDAMPGSRVVPPPGFSPAGGTYSNTVVVTLSVDEPEAAIHYTLDGSRPTTSDPLYQAPIKLTAPTTIRAKAFKPGCVKSITTQQTFIVGD